MGRSIRIYLADGNVAGIRHAEIVNWTGQALAFSRNGIGELKNWPEVRRQGVYFLLGTDEKTGQDVVYIGEAEVVAERVPQHIANKEFWSECVVFTSKDENLTKSHIKYLESRLVTGASAAGRYLVTNSATPTESGLPRADRDAMDEFAVNIRILLGVLGHRVLDPVLQSSRPAPALVPLPQEPTEDPRTFSRSTWRKFSLHSGGLTASAIRDTDALVVLAESMAAKEIAPSLSIGYRTIRERLLNAGVLVDAGDHLKFLKNYPFPSPSQAAALIVGYMVNGRQLWKSEDGKSLGELEDIEAAGVERVLAEHEEHS
jgi:hypothetical protein